MYEDRSIRGEEENSNSDNSQRTHHEVPLSSLPEPIANSPLEESIDADASALDHSLDHPGQDDETWDLRSPLIEQTPLRNEYPHSRQNSLPLEAEDGQEAEEILDLIDPWRLSLSICALSMSLLFVVLVGGSFFYPWSDTTVRLSMDMSGKSFPFDFNLPLYTNAKFSDTVSIFKQSHSNALVVLVISSTIVAPSLWMLSQVFFITSVNHGITSRAAGITETENENGGILAKCLPSLYAEKSLSRLIAIPLFFTKYSMSIVYVNSIILVATSHIRLAFGGDYSPGADVIHKKNINDENGNFIFAEIENETRGGIVSYVVGITLGIGAFMFFRNFIIRDGMEKRNTANVDESPAVNGGGGILSPPPLAFQLRGLPNEDELALNESTDEDYRDLSTPLLNMMNDGSSIENDTPSGEEEVGENGTVREKEELSAEEGNKRGWREIVEFEIGLLTFLLALPLLTQPLIQLKYTGMITPVFNEVASETVSLTLADIIGTITKKGGQGPFPIIMSSLLWINVIIIPIVNWICCSVSWGFKSYSTGNRGDSFKVHAKYIHPLSHMTPFALSIFAAVASLEQVSNFLFSENSFCPILRSVLPVGVGDHCLQISAHVQPGLFFLLAQTLLVDVFLFFEYNE